MSSAHRDSSGPTDSEEEEDTRTWTVDPEVLAQERGAGDRSAVRDRPEDDRKPVSTERIDVERVRALYARFLDVLGPAAKVFFQETLRELGFVPSQMTEADLPVLEARLASLITLPAQRERFLAKSARLR